MIRISAAHAGTILAVAFTLSTSVPRILAQSHVQSQPQSPVQSQLSWLTVRDAREQAFSVDVPKGWKSFGGMYRASIIDARPFVDMTSPDGQINVRLGDASIPTYSAPQGNLMQRRQPVNVTGQLFAAKYGQARFSHMCQGLRLARNEAKPPKYTQPGQGALRGTAGEAVFSCTVNGQPRTAYVYAETFIAGYGQPLANWTLVALGSFFAPTDQAASVTQIFVHSAQSLAMNPAWTQMQNGFNQMATQRNMQNAMATIRATAAMNAYQQRVIANMDHEQQNFNDIINGVSLQRDPTTGREYETPLGTGGPQWIDPASNAAVQSALSPGAGFNRLETISR